MKVELMSDNVQLGAKRAGTRSIITESHTVTDCYSHCPFIFVPRVTSPVSFLLTTHTGCLVEVKFHLVTIVLSDFCVFVSFIIAITILVQVRWLLCHSKKFQ